MAYLLDDSLLSIPSEICIPRPRIHHRLDLREDVVRLSTVAFLLRHVLRDALLHAPDLQVQRVELPQQASTLHHFSPVVSAER